MRRPATLLPNVVQLGSISIDMSSRLVWKNGEQIELQPKEMDLLQFLIRHPDQFFTAEQLIARVWGSEAEGSLQAVAQCVKRLRQRIDEPNCDSLIKTRRRVGYGVNRKDLRA